MTIRGKFKDYDLANSSDEIEQGCSESAALEGIKRITEVFPIDTSAMNNDKDEKQEKKVMIASIDIHHAMDSEVGMTNPSMLKQILKRGITSAPVNKLKWNLK